MRRDWSGTLRRSSQIPYTRGKEMVMPTRSKITSKAQLTVPRVVRDAMHLGPGDVVEWQPDGDEFRIHKVTSKEKSPLDKWMGSVDAGMTPDQIMEELRGPRYDHVP